MRQHPVSGGKMIETSKPGKLRMYGTRLLKDAGPLEVGIPQKNAISGWGTGSNFKACQLHICLRSSFFNFSIQVSIKEFLHLVGNIA